MISFFTRIKEMFNSDYIKNQNLLLLLVIFNCSILLNFDVLFLTNPLLAIVFFIMVLLSFLNYKLWWATGISMGITFVILLIKFPRLTNHANIQFFIILVSFGCFCYKFYNSKFKIASNLLSYVFRVALVSMYFYTGFHKLNTDFFNPCVSCVNEINVYIFENFTGIRRAISPQYSTFFQYATFFVEMVLPFGLFSRHTRKLTAIFLLAFHFYLNFAVYSDFSSLALFLIIGSVIDFESPIISNKIITPLRFYVFFTLITFIVKLCLIKYGVDKFYLGFVQGSIYNIGWLIFIYSFFKNYSEKTYVFEKKYTVAIASCFILISFWTLRTYIGLGNTANFTMFSNLITEKSRSNHLLLDTKYTKIFDLEEDNVLVLKLSDSLQEQNLENHKIPITEFKFLSKHWCRYYSFKIKATIVYKNDTIVINDLGKSEFVKTKWWYKYLYFRKIKPEGANDCDW